MIRVEYEIQQQQSIAEGTNMAAEITKRDGNSITVRLEDTMLEAEESIQEAVNEVRMALEHEKRVRSDTDESHRSGGAGAADQ